ncbi:MAG: hypothetical protein LBH00_06795 [Planctomycetaceae bacterium]|jgi:hypothetical protein|nr:hypothetical protein [Planctomycetaceae bacterium]
MTEKLMFNLLCPGLIATGLLILSETFSAGGTARLPNEENVQHIQSLTKRGLFDAADAFCNEKFQSPDLPESDKMELAAELVRTKPAQWFLADRTAGQTQREKIVRRIAAVEKLFADPDAVYRRDKHTNKATGKNHFILQLQIAMAYSELGEYQYLDGDKKKASAALLDALDRFKKYLSQATFNHPPDRNSPDFDWEEKQKLFWRDTLRMQSGIARKFYALTLDNINDRQFELHKAADTFAEIDSVPCKLERAACFRLCGETEKCGEILSRIQTDKLSAAVKLQYDAEMIRFMTASGKAEEARKQFENGAEDSRLFPDYDIARLELFLADEPSRNIKPASAAAAKLLQKIEQEHGQLWRKRAGILFAAAVKESHAVHDVFAAATLAESRYKENRFAESAELYEQAADKTGSAGDAVKYCRSAAAAWNELLKQKTGSGKNEVRSRLIKLLRKVPVHYPQQPESAELHLFAVDLTGQSAVEQTASPDDYLAVIAEHENVWRDSPKLPQLRRQKAVLLTQLGRLNEAAEVLPMLTPEQLKTCPPEVQMLRAKQLDAEGKTQEAAGMLETLLKQKKEDLRVMQILAEMQTRQNNQQDLQNALRLWTLLEQKSVKNSEPWWAAREGILTVLCKLNRKNEAGKSFEMLRVLYPALGGTERKDRLLKMFGTEF